MRIALALEYNGAAFHGWQSQAGLDTVQAALENALRIISRHETPVVCAGRTDAGVHACCQIVHFDTDAVRPLSAWVRGVNSHLPDQMAVLWARRTADRFHARFDAHTRHYRYVLVNRPQRPALLHERIGWIHRPLALESMRRAALSLLGEHDFSTFRASECQAKSPVKTMRRIDICQNGCFFIFEFSASAFLHHMVRNLVGALVAIGKGEKPETWLTDILAAKDRRLGAPTMPAAGLYLLGVDYDPAWDIPAWKNSISLFPFDSLTTGLEEK